MRKRWIYSSTRVDGKYVDVQEFLKDMRAGDLPEGFSLADDVFGDLCVMANTDKELAAEIADHGLLVVLASSNKAETEGLLAIAEASREG